MQPEYFYLRKPIRKFQQSAQQDPRTKFDLQRSVSKIAYSLKTENDIQQVLNFLSDPDVGQFADQSQIARRIVDIQSPENLDRIIAGYVEACTEVCALIVHELVIRSVDVLQYASFERLVQQLEATQHPLSRLPLYLLNYEVNLNEAYGLNPHGGFVPEQRYPYKPAFQEISDPHQPTQMIAVFENWKEHSNGMTEARSFHYKSPLDPDKLENSTLLLELGLECLQGSSASDLHINRLDPNAVLRILFTAASYGGAYNSGLSHAYGRLEMWESVAGLMSLTSDTKIEDLHAALNNYVWFNFETRSDSWFYMVIWDVGIAVYNNDRQLLNILAATDTD